MAQREHLTRAGFIRLGTAVCMGAAGASVVAACSGGGDTGGGNQTTAVGGTDGVEETTQATAETTEGGRSDNAQEAGSANAIVDEAPGTAVQFTDESGQPAVLVHL